jgi:hypothetical protein
MSKIDVSSYEKNKGGEMELIKDLFQEIKQSLGFEHQDDSIGMILHSSALSSVYLNKYQKLKE